jgi:hypothetical protein
MNLDSALLIPFVPVVVLVIGLIGWAVIDIVRAPRVRHLPKAIWVLVVVLCVPVGAVLYLVLGRDRRQVLRDEEAR